MRVYILTEGGKNIGFGHITRCTALYQAFEEKGVIPEFIVNGDESVVDLLKNLNYSVFNWIEKKKELFDLVMYADVAVIDSYLADVPFYEALSSIVKRTVYIDDNKRLNYPEGIVVNGSIYAEELQYPQKDGITYLLGLKYFPLRKEFWNVPGKKIKENIESVMITFGGDDMRNMTPKVLKFLNDNFPGLIKNVVIGKGFHNIEEIEKLKNDRTNLIYYPNAEYMKNIMLESDIVISAAGQTLYELARVGTPTIAIAVAENQLSNVEGWEGTNYIEYIGWWESSTLFENITKALKKYLSEVEKKSYCLKRRNLVDGQGARRIVDWILNRIQGS